MVEVVEDRKRRKFNEKFIRNLNWKEDWERKEKMRNNLRLQKETIRKKVQDSTNLLKI